MNNCWEPDVHTHPCMKSVTQCLPPSCLSAGMGRQFCSCAHLPILPPPSPAVVWSAGQKVCYHQGNQVSMLPGCLSLPWSDVCLPHLHTTRECSWSPAGHMISYWVPESNDIPAKITIMAIPSRAEISTKSRHLVNEVSMETPKDKDGHYVHTHKQVHTCSKAQLFHKPYLCSMVVCSYTCSLSLPLPHQFKLHWHKQGDYLCVKVDHWTSKNKKVRRALCLCCVHTHTCSTHTHVPHTHVPHTRSTHMFHTHIHMFHTHVTLQSFQQLCNSFEIFHLRDVDVPVDTLEIKGGSNDS